MFNHITGTSDTAHATVVSRTDIDFLHPARFMSEFLACTAADSEDCRKNPTNGPHKTVKALRRTGPTDWQKVEWDAAGDAPCTETLDWPVQRVILVDRTEQQALRGKPAFCNVYDRLPPFQVCLARAPPLSLALSRARAGPRRTALSLMLYQHTRRSASPACAARARGTKPRGSAGRVACTG